MTSQNDKKRIILMIMIFVIIISPNTASWVVLLGSTVCRDVGIRWGPSEFGWYLVYLRAELRCLTSMEIHHFQQYHFHRTNGQHHQLRFA